MEANFLWADYTALGVEIADEEKWSLIRNYRDRALYHCDWTQLADVPLTREEQIKSWRVYRQTLRDIPTLYMSPDHVVFPTPPEGEPV
jgi:hypothetical protein